MNWIVIACLSLGLVAFPFFILGITALVGGMLMVARNHADRQPKTSPMFEQNKNIDNRD